MENRQQFPYKNIYLLGAFVFLVTAWFSQGFNHFDEHFQILEFAGMKLGLTTPANLPWEYGCMMRPALQPGIVYLVCRFFSLAGLTNPFFLAFIIRLLSASLTFLGITMIVRAFLPEINNRKLQVAFVMLSLFLWFVPYNSARFSSDTTSGVIFLIAFAWFRLHDKAKLQTYLFTGLLMGIAFITKYQVAFMVLGFGLWLLIINRSGWGKFMLFGAGIVLAAVLGILVDRWFYGEWVLTAYNYFDQNILMGKASAFGIHPWWHYLEQVFMNAIPPFSLVYILAVLLCFLYYPKDALTWIFLPFLAIHFIVPHKEIRFLFPIIGFLPIMIIRAADLFMQKIGPARIGKRWVKIIVRLFWITNLVMLVILTFRPADDQISLYKKLWNSYAAPAKLCFIDENPYHRARVDVWFYKRNSLVFRQVDSLQLIVLSKDTTTLFVTNKADLISGKQFRPQLVYSSLPQWVRHFNINHWIERTSFWYVYELKQE